MTVCPHCGKPLTPPKPPFGGSRVTVQGRECRIRYVSQLDERNGEVEVWDPLTGEVHRIEHVNGERFLDHMQELAERAVGVLA